MGAEECDNLGTHADVPAGGLRAEAAGEADGGERRKGPEAVAGVSALLSRLSWAGVAAGIALILNVVVLKVGRGSYLHISLVLQGILFVGLPAFVVSLVLMCIGMEKRPRLFAAGYAANLVSVVTFLMIISACAGLFVATADIKDARRYCERLIPRLEKYNADTGSYPATIDAVASRENEPRLLKGVQFYIPQADGYLLEFRMPQKRNEMMEYSSWKGRWERRR